MTDIKTTHVGSLPRPQEMHARMLREQPITTDELRQYVSAVVEKQLSAGITYINNGETPRPDYVSSKVTRISGFGDTSTWFVPFIALETGHQGPSGSDT